MEVVRAFQALTCFAVMGLFFVSAGRVEAQTSTVTIISVQCVKATLGSDTDEIFIRWAIGNQPFGPTPTRKISNGQTWKPNHTISFNADDGLAVFLYEADEITDSDTIGVIRIEAGKDGGLYRETLEGDFSKYIVSYKLIR